MGSYICSEIPVRAELGDRTGDPGGAAALLAAGQAADPPNCIFPRPDGCSDQVTRGAADPRRARDDQVGEPRIVGSWG